MPRSHSIPSRTRQRRLLILGGVLLAIGVLAGGLYLAKEWRFNAWLDFERAEGLRCLDAGDPETAITHLTHIFRHRPEDREAILAFAAAREAVRTDDRRHLLATINIYTRLAELDPDDLDTRRNLMRLYALVGFGTEAEREADAVLGLAGEDPDALAVKLSVAKSRGRSDDADRLASRLLAASDADFDALRTRLALTLDGDLSLADALTQVRGWSLPPALEAGRLAIVAEMELRGGDPAAALATANQAASLDSIDPKAIAAIADLFDQLARPDLADAMLEARIESMERPSQVIDAAMRRLWRSSRIASGMDLLTLGEARLGRSDPLILQWRIRIAALGGGARLLDVNAASYEASFEKLDPIQRRAAGTWLAAMLLAADGDASASELQAALDAAIEADGTDSMLWFLRGRLHFNAMRLAEAIEDLEIARRIDLGRAVPTNLLLATALDGSGQPGRALEVASELLSRAGDQLAVISTFAAIWDTFDRTGRSTSELRLASLPTMELLPFTKIVFERSEGDPRLASLLATIGARVGDQAAVEEGLSVLDDTRPIPPILLERLANVAVETESVTAETALRRLEAVAPRSRELARLRAVQNAKAGDPQEAFDRYAEALDGLGDEIGDLDRISRLAGFARRFSLASADDLETRRLEVLRGPTGSAIALLESESNWTDEATARALIDRAAQELSSDHPLVLMSEAIWITRFRPKEDVRRSPVAAALMTEMEQGSENPMLPLVLARLLATADPPDEAMIDRALRRRLQLAPRDMGTAVELAERLIAAGQAGAAAELADELFARGDGDDAARRAAVSILRASGRRARAIEACRSLVTATNLDADRLVLAQLLRESDDPDEQSEAGRILIETAARPEATLEAVLAAAAWEIDNALADQAEERLRTRDAQQGDIDLPVRLLELWLLAGDVDRADAAAAALQALGRTDEEAVVPLANWLVARDRTDDAVALVRELLMQDLDRTVLLNWAAARIDHPGWQLLESPALRAALAGAAPGLMALSELRAQATGPDGTPIATPETIERSLALVEAYPRLQAAWRIAAVLHSAAGRGEEAIDIARRGTAEIPQSAILQQLLAELLIRSGRATEAAAVLETLAELPDRNRRVVSILRGEVALALGSPLEAIDAVGELDAADADANAIRAAANLDRGRVADAQALLGGDLVALANLGLGRIPSISPDAARSLAEAVRPLAEGQPDLATALANALLQCHLRSGDSGVLDLAEELLDGLPEDTPNTQMIRGEIVAERGSPADALAFYRAAYEAIPPADRALLAQWSSLPESQQQRLAGMRMQAALALNNMAYRSCQAGIVSGETLDMIDGVLEMLPEVAAFRDTRALVLLELDRIPEARADAESAVRGLPDDPTVRLTYARILQRSQSNEAALREVEKGLQLLDETPNARPELRARFTRLQRALERAITTPGSGDRNLPGYLDGNRR